jgi:prepilin-type processing-associated H-X9-DG protein
MWMDTLSLLVNRRTQVQGGALLPDASSPSNLQNMAYDYSPIFHDTDTAELPYEQRASDYTANIRCIPDIADITDAWDPTGTHVEPLRQIGSIQRPAEVMMVWCGCDNISNGITNQGVNDPCDWQIDCSGAANGNGWGYGSCYPKAPPGSGYNSYTKLLAVGNDGTHWSGANNVTLAVLKSQNVDNQNPTWDPTCEMRFRHMGNTEANFLFADGHVESR